MEQLAGRNPREGSGYRPVPAEEESVSGSRIHTERRVSLRLLCVLAGLSALIGVGATRVVDESGFQTGGGGGSVIQDTGNDSFDHRVREYILSNPGVIVEAVRRLKVEREALANDDARAVLQERADEVFRDPASPVGGVPTGDVTLVEFFDYNCGYCRRVAKVMNEAEAADGQLRIVYKEFPILGPGSLVAAKAALAAERQGKYVQFHKAMMNVEGAIDADRVFAVAASIGLDAKRLKADMKDPLIEEAIERNRELARSLRIVGTPGFVLGDRIMRGAMDLGTLLAAVDGARSRR